MVERKQNKHAELWEKYFKPPYRFDDLGIYLFDQENQMRLKFLPFQ